MRCPVIPSSRLSRNLGNVINPDEVVDQYGADTMRLYDVHMTLSRLHLADLCHCRLQPLPGPRVGPERQAGGGRGLPPQIETDAPDHQKVGADIEGPR